MSWGVDNSFAPEREWNKHEQCNVREFPGGPVVRTLSFQCRGPGFDPWLGN